jgi:hypothetical protein
LSCGVLERLDPSLRQKSDKTVFSAIVVSGAFHLILALTQHNILPRRVLFGRLNHQYDQYDEDEYTAETFVIIGVPCFSCGTCAGSDLASPRRRRLRRLPLHVAREQQLRQLYMSVSFQGDQSGCGGPMCGHGDTPGDFVRATPTNTTRRPFTPPVPQLPPRTVYLSSPGTWRSTTTIAL